MTNNIIRNPHPKVTKLLKSSIIPGEKISSVKYSTRLSKGIVSKRNRMQSDKYPPNFVQYLAKRKLQQQQIRIKIIVKLLNPEETWSHDSNPEETPKKDTTDQEQSLTDKEIVLYLYF